jgi:hypothetical protein
MEKKTLDDALKGQLQNVIKEAKQQFVAAKESKEKDAKKTAAAK